MATEIIHFDKDIEVLCVTADSFPDGVSKAFDELSKKIPSLDGRIFYGISYEDQNGRIIYKAAVNQIEDNEAEKYHCESFLVRKGNYIRETISNFMKNIPLIGETFKKLLAEPRVDRISGYCLERYPNPKDIECMVTLES